jgi:hypothetical protein
MARPKKCGRCNKPKRPKGKKYIGLQGYCECGRKTVMTESTLQKLKDAFSIGLNDGKSCAYAGICTSTLHNYQNENQKFLEEKERLRMNPDIKAQQTVVASLGDPNHAWRWLEKKDIDFMPKSKVEHAGIIEINNTVEMSEEEKQALDSLRIARRKRIEDSTKQIDNKSQSL